MSTSTLPPLSRHPMLEGLPASALDRMSTWAREVNFGAGQSVFREGSPADAFYLLRSGKVSLSTHAPGRGALVVQTLGAGEALGLSWMFPPYLWQFDAQCVEGSEAFALMSSGVREELEADPSLGYEFLKRYVPIALGRLQQTRLRLLDLYGKGSHKEGSGEGGSGKDGEWPH